ncbi:MAG TPA: hypothetical protein DEH27_02140, partial [Deltaproteobacteria bacterium]|nr:hypothetical protein [Deltaproteobacteria bacterium]
MDCRETQTLLTAFHDGELPNADRTRVENHLQGCPECGRLLADLARADEVAGVPDPGPGYWDRFNARVADRIERKAEVPRVAVLRPKQGWMRQQLRFLVPAVAAAALVVVVVRFGGRGPVAPKPAVPPAESVEERSALDSAGQRMAKGEVEPPAAKKTVDAAVSERLTAESKRAAEAPTAAIATERFPAPVREERDRLADRSLPEEKEGALRDHAAAPAGIGAPSPPPAEPQHPAKAESASGMRIGKDQVAAEAPAGPVGKAKEREAPSTLSSDATRTPSPCELARTLAAQEHLEKAEAAQRECLAQDPSPPAQEKGLIFLAELLDRQARFAEADEVLT